MVKKRSATNNNELVKKVVDSEKTGMDYLDTRDAAIEADRAALRRRRTTFRGAEPTLGEPTEWVFDRRNKYGTGAWIVYSKTEKGAGRVVYFMEDEAVTTCAIKNYKLHGDEVKCEPPHEVVRRWEYGKIVPIEHPKQTQSQQSPARQKRNSGR